MPKAFVLTGGSRSQLGLLEQARALGHEVCVVDGSDRAPLLAEADHAIVRSFTDVNGVIGELEARGIKPVAVATMGSDQAVLPTAQLAERLGLPGLPVAAARTVADKRRMRAAFEKRKVRFPKGREAASFEEAEQAFHQLGAPVVVKPVDGSAQRGVTEVRTEGELPDAVDRALTASRSGALVLEQYLDGDEFTVNGFLLDREYFPMSVTQRLLYPPPPLGVCIAHRYPSGLRNEERIFEFAHAASCAVGLKTGPSYVQIRIQDGHAYGVGTLPLAIRGALDESKPLGAFVDLSAGLQYFFRAIPDDRATRLNAQLMASAGLRSTIGQKLEGELAYRLLHISNGGTATANPGLNFHQIAIGVGFRPRKR